MLQGKVILKKSEGRIAKLCVVRAGLQYSTECDEWSHRSGAGRYNRLNEILCGRGVRLVRGVRDVPIGWVTVCMRIVVRPNVDLRA